MSLIGIVGFIGSGKGTVGDIFKDKYKFSNDSFAKPLKDCVSIIFNWDRKMLEGDTQKSRLWREEKDFYWSEVLGIDFTPRLALQLFGTEACRKGLHTDIWIMSLLNRIKSNKDTVVTDVRFRNEVDIIQEHGGNVIRIVRGPDPVWYDELASIYSDNQREDFMKQFNIHRSEWDWVGSDFDYVVLNNGTLQELQEEIDKIYKTINEKGE